MTFRCPTCGTKHNLEAAGLSGATTGSVVKVPWDLQDEHGQDLDATVCLRCGSVHATRESRKPSFFSLGRAPSYDVVFSLTPRQTEELLHERADALPLGVIELLRRHGFIRVDLERAAESASGMVDVQLALFCALERNGTFGEEAVDAFLAKAGTYEHQAGGRTPFVEAQLAAANAARTILSYGVSKKALAAKAEQFYLASLRDDVGES